MAATWDTYGKKILGYYRTWIKNSYFPYAFRSNPSDLAIVGAFVNLYCYWSQDNEDFPVQDRDQLLAKLVNVAKSRPNRTDLLVQVDKTLRPYQPAPGAANPLYDYFRCQADYIDTILLALVDAMPPA